MKFKIFKLSKEDVDELIDMEKKVNKFMEGHEVVQMQFTFMGAIPYVACMYEEEKNDDAKTQPSVGS